jgi:hypothetical protein
MLNRVFFGTQHKTNKQRIERLESFANMQVKLNELLNQENSNHKEDSYPILGPTISISKPDPVNEIINKQKTLFLLG